MSTRTNIIQLGDSLIREKGFNAFSFSDISKQLHIRNASVHYHFPTKTALALAVIQEHQDRLQQLILDSAQQNPLDKLQAFMGIYTEAKSSNRICLVGSLASDFRTVEPAIQQELKKLTQHILNWVAAILKEGKDAGLFHFNIPERAKALMVITNMLAAVQLTRITSKQDFKIIKDNVINDLIQST